MLSNILATALKMHHKTTFRIHNLMSNRLLLILSFLFLITGLSELSFGQTIIIPSTQPNISYGSGGGIDGGNQAYIVAQEVKLSETATLNSLSFYVTTADGSNMEWQYTV